MSGFSLAIPTPRRLAKALREVRESRADPDPLHDETVFRNAWSLSGKLGRNTDAFTRGELPHQLALGKQLETDYERAGKVLDALTQESINYLSTFVIFLAAMTALKPDLLERFIHSNLRIFIWFPAYAFLRLLRSHASPLKSLLDNYRGAGERAADCLTTYDRYNKLREDICKLNARSQRAKRALAVVSLCFSLIIVLACGYLTVTWAVHIFG